MGELTEKQRATRQHQHQAASWPAKVGFLQFRVRFGDPAANLAVVRRRLAALAPPSGALLVLPELWSGGFAYRELAALAAETPVLLAALAAEARRYGIYLAGSLPEARPSAAGRPGYHNTLYLVGSDGVLATYHKQRLFAPMAEPDHFRPGLQAGPLVTPFGPVAGLVCFDLRFPELAAAQVRRGAGLLLLAAQWPLARREHWRVLLRARAIENQIFLVAGNTCGRVGDTDFAGNSTIIAPDGEVLAEAGETATARLVSLDYSRLVEVRQRFCTAGGRG